MLQNLRIKHYALIENLDIDFSSGYSVITGETGAGKSILLGALGLLQGERADAKAIQNDAKKCIVEATFRIDALHLEHLFEENDIDFDAEFCVLRRELGSNGKSRAFINDSPVSLAVMKLISSHLIDIHSQHQNLLLQHEHFLLDLLDTIAENENILSAYKEKYAQYHKFQKELDELKNRSNTDKSEADYLQFQVNQLEVVGLTDGEQEELEEEVEILSHAEDIKSGLFFVNNALNGEENNVIATFNQVCDTLHNISRVYSPAKELAERIDSIRIELKDIAGDVDSALENIEYDPVRLNYVNERLQTIYDLQKKHRVNTIAELLALAQELRDRLSGIENADELIAEKERKLLSLHKELKALGQDLHRSRVAAGEKICTNLITRMQALGMPHTNLQFSISAKETFTSNGTDNAELLFSANKNAALRSVAQIASGGEIARLMLALKTLISYHKNLPTVIFDEIDTGVSGTIAEKMAVAMKEMSEHCQVICITHLPQIAAAGIHHYRVYKEDTDKATTSHILRLSNEERITEISKMLSGEQITDAAIENAKVLLRL